MTPSGGESTSGPAKSDSTTIAAAPTTEVMTTPRHGNETGLETTVGGGVGAADRRADEPASCPALVGARW